MADYLTQNALWWVEYLGLAGIRMDTWPYPDKHYMAEWTRRVMLEYPDFNIVGEEWEISEGDFEKIPKPGDKPRTWADVAEK